MILGIDHVGLAVFQADTASATFASLTDKAAGAVEALDEQLVRVCFLPIGGVALELLEPAGEESTIARFLARRGEGLHHVCFAVDDIEAEMQRLEGAGFHLLDEAPRRGHGGRVAFLHPKSAHGVLVELLQRDPEHKSSSAGDMDVVTDERA